MKGIHTLLAATDLSGPARHAAERAALLARDQNAARFDLLHVVSGVSLRAIRRLLTTGADELERQLVAEAEQALLGISDGLARAFGVSAAARVRVGNVLDEIAKAAEEAAAELLIMGARGANFVREFMLGTTAERMIRKTVRPVLAVKQFPHEPYRRVLVPVDFSPHSKPALALACSIAPDAAVTVHHAFEVPFEGKLRIASVSEDIIRSYRIWAKQQALQDMEDLISSLTLPREKVIPEVEHGPASRLILEKEQEIGADLIVMGKHGQSMLEELLLGSVTKHILAYSNCDVLIAGRCQATGLSVAANRG